MRTGATFSKGVAPVGGPSDPRGENKVEQLAARGKVREGGGQATEMESLTAGDLPITGSANPTAQGLVVLRGPRGCSRAWVQRL